MLLICITLYCALNRHRLTCGLNNNIRLSFPGKQTSNIDDIILHSRVSCIFLSSKIETESFPPPHNTCVWLASRLWCKLQSIGYSFHQLCLSCSCGRGLNHIYLACISKEGLDVSSATARLHLLSLRHENPKPDVNEVTLLYESLVLPLPVPMAPIISQRIYVFHYRASFWRVVCLRLWIRWLPGACARQMGAAGLWERK